MLWTAFGVSVVGTVPTSYWIACPICPATRRLPAVWNLRRRRRLYRLRHRLIMVTVIIMTTTITVAAAPALSKLMVMRGKQLRTTMMSQKKKLGTTTNNTTNLHNKSCCSVCLTRWTMLWLMGFIWRRTLVHWRTNLSWVFVLSLRIWILKNGITKMVIYIYIQYTRIQCIYCMYIHVLLFPLPLSPCLSKIKIKKTILSISFGDTHTHTHTHMYIQKMVPIQKVHSLAKWCPQYTMLAVRHARDRVLDLCKRCTNSRFRPLVK